MKIFCYEKGFGFSEISDTMVSGLKGAWKEANRYYQSGWALYIQFSPNGEKVPFADLKAKKTGKTIKVNISYSFNNQEIETRYIRINSINTIGDVIDAIKKEFGVNVIPNSWSTETNESPWTGSHRFERWNGPMSCYYYNVKML